MPFDILGPIGAIQSGQTTLEYGNVGVSNCVYLCLKGDEQVVPCLIFTPEELESLLAMVDLACSEQERLEQGSVVRLGVTHPKPITLRVALIHPHNAKPVLLLRFCQGQWKSDVMAPPKDVALLLRQGKVDGPAPLNGSLKKVDASTWQLEEKKLLLLEGLSAGYGFAGTTDDNGNDIDTDGFIGGGFAGMQWQNGNFVYGVEGDVNYNGMDGANAGVESESRVDGSLRGRLGYSVTPDVLLYGTAGGAAQSLKIRDAVGSDTNSMVGWTAGVGADIKVTEQVFGRVEYRYSDYGSADFNTGAGDRSIDSTDNRITFGVGMKF